MVCSLSEPWGFGNGTLEALGFNEVCVNIWEHLAVWSKTLFTCCKSTSSNELISNQNIKT